MAIAMLPARVSRHAGKVMFSDGTLLELTVQLRAGLLRTGKENQSGGVGIEPVYGPQRRLDDLVEDRLQGIAVEAAAGVHRQRCGLADDADRLVLMEKTNVRVHIGFCNRGEALQVAVSRAYDAVSGGDFSIRCKETALGQSLLPCVCADLWKSIDKQFEQTPAVMRLFHRQGEMIFVGHAAGKRVGYPCQVRLSHRQDLFHGLILAEGRRWMPRPCLSMPGVWNGAGRLHPDDRADIALGGTDRTG